MRIEETDHDYHFIANISNPPTACPSCQSDTLRGHGRSEQLIHDMPTRQALIRACTNWQPWILEYKKGRLPGALRFLPNQRSKQEESDYPGE